MRRLGPFVVLDEWQTDWKVVAIDVRHLVTKLSDVGEVEKVGMPASFPWIYKAGKQSHKPKRLSFLPGFWSTIADVSWATQKK